jgi:hypothetical protein
MTMRVKIGWALFGGLTLTMSGCAKPPIPVQPPLPIVTVTPPPPPMPAGGYVGMKIPAKLEDGDYFTPNLNNTDQAAVWHLRNALNVAALGCDLEGGGIVDAYNAWIKGHAAAIDRYYQAYVREWQEPGWIDWQRVYDDDQTRIYNFYAQPAMRAGFCAAARVEVAQVGQVADGDLPTFARAALLRLDRPFVDFYKAFDAWRTFYRPASAPITQTTDIPVVVVPPPVITTPAGNDTPEPAPSPASEPQ